MKKTKLLGGAVLALALLISPFAMSTQAANNPNWDTSGTWVVNMEYGGTEHAHDMTLTQDSAGNLTGSGGSPSGSNVYTWVVTSGLVAGDTFDLLADYTATADAVTPQTILHLMGTIASDGTITGTWSDNYQGGSRSGALTTVSGSADLLGSLAAEDFGVVNYDTGLGILKGYTAGFGLADANFEDVQSVIVRLYSGATLLQTNTATSKVGDTITGSQISSPFDVSGTFDYTTDGYWTNVRETQYGQSMPATRVVADVILENGKILTAENTNLTGNPSDIYPPATDTHILTVALAGTGTGSVTSSPTGINCGADCSESYDEGTDVTLTASASAGSTFTGWTGGGCSGTGTCMVDVGAATTVTATFTLDQTPTMHTLTAQVLGKGSGDITSSPAGIDCGSDCSESYAHGTVVVLTATPDAGSKFSGWAGACLGQGKGTCTLTIDANTTVKAAKAEFAKIPVVTPPTDPSADACKNGGWATFTNPSFKNQGQCVSYHNHNS